MHSDLTRVQIKIIYIFFELIFNISLYTPIIVLFPTRFPPPQAVFFLIIGSDLVFFEDLTLKTWFRVQWLSHGSFTTFTIKLHCALLFFYFSYSYEAAEAWESLVCWDIFLTRPRNGFYYSFYDEHTRQLLDNVVICAPRREGYWL